MQKVPPLFFLLSSLLQGNAGIGILTRVRSMLSLRIGNEIPLISGVNVKNRKFTLDNGYEVANDDLESNSVCLSFIASQKLKQTSKFSSRF